MELGVSGVLPDDVQALPIAGMAVRLNIPVSRVQQLIRDGHLLATKRDGAFVVPVDFVDGVAVVKGLPGTVTVLRDGGFTDEEILRWLFAEDSSLPGTPITALRSNRGREVKRRAQAMAF
ncbi:MAG: Rv2175c family DNA-binding protein [Pseudonocardia sp.]